MGSDIAPFTTRIEARNGVARIALEGELVTATVPTLEQQLQHFEQIGVNAIMLDLRDLAFINSSGLYAFLRAKERSKANGHRFILVGAGPVSQRLFALTRTEFLLDEEEAASVLDEFTGSAVGRATQDLLMDL
jgi:anti-anti-sigma factor